MAITYVNVSHGAAHDTPSSSSCSVSVSAPSGCQQDDVMIAQVHCGDTGTSPTVNPIAGWTQIGTYVSGSAYDEGCIFYRVFQSGDTSWNFSVSGSGTGSLDIGVIITAYRGVDTNNPIHRSTTGTQQSADLSLAGVTTTKDGCMAVFALMDDALGTTNFSNEQINSVSMTEAYEGGIGWVDDAMCYLLLGSAGATGNATASNAYPSYLTIMFLLCLAPAGAAGGPEFTLRSSTASPVDVSSLSGNYDFQVYTPPTYQNGDILFTFIITRSSSGRTIDQVPTGWELVCSNEDNGDRYYLYWKIANDEDVWYTWSLSGSAKVSACEFAYYGDFDVASLSDITISNTAYRTSNTTIRAADFNVPAANSPLLYFGGLYKTSSTTITDPSAPDTWNQDKQYGSTTCDIYADVCSMVWTGSGSTGNIDGTSSSSITTKHAFALALKPTATNQTYNESLALAAAAALAQLGPLTIGTLLSMTATSGFAHTGGKVMDEDISLAAAAGWNEGVTDLISTLLNLATSGGLTQVPALTANPTLGLPASTGMAQVGPLVVPASSTLAASVALAQSVAAVMGGSLSLVGTTAMTPAAINLITTVLSLTGSPGLAQEAALTARVALALASGAGFTSASIQTLQAVVDLTQNAAMLQAGNLVMTGTISLDQAAIMAQVGGSNFINELTLSSNALLSESSLLALLGSLSLDIGADLDQAVVLSLAANLDLLSSAGLGTNTIMVMNDSIVIVAVPAFTPDGVIEGGAVTEACPYLIIFRRRRF
jgi:hypothetical protein